MSVWQVNEDAINALTNLTSQVRELTESITQQISNLNDTFQSNSNGLGKHSDVIGTLLQDINTCNNEANRSSNKLQVKLNKAITIRKNHIENNKYKSGNQVSNNSSVGRYKNSFIGLTQTEHKPYISNREDKIKAIQEDVKMGSGKTISESQASEMLNGVTEFTGCRSTPIRIAYNNPNADAHDAASLRALDDYINSAPKWKGQLYRGISVSNEQAESILSGDFVDMLGPSSWSSERTIAEQFSNGYKDVRIVFILDDNKSGASIAHIGALDGIESEVTAPSGVKYGIDKISRESGIIYIDVHEN